MVEEEQFLTLLLQSVDKINLFGSELIMTLLFLSGCLSSKKDKTTVVGNMKKKNMIRGPKSYFWKTFDKLPIK